MGNLGILQALIFEPRKAFAAIRERPRFWFPLLLLAVGSGLLTAWYMLKVDGEWLMDLQLRNNQWTSQLTEEQIQTQARAAAANRGVRAAISAIAYVVFIPIAYLIGALYYYLAGKITNVQFSFKQWYALACWTGLPAVLSLIAGALVLLSTTATQIDPGEIKPLSLNALFFHREMGEPKYTLLSSLELTMIFSSILGVIGVKQWSGRSWLFSAVFALLPAIVMFGIWAAV